MEETEEKGLIGELVEKVKDLAVGNGKGEEPASDSTSEPAAPAQANDAAAVDLAGPVEEAEAAPEADADADADTTTETASAPTPTKSGKKGKKGKGN